MIRYLLSAVFAGLDLHLKTQAEADQLPKEKIGHLRFVKAHNYGFAGNLCDQRPLIPKATSCIMLLVSMVYLHRQKNTSKGFLLGSALFLGGAFSNTIDRLHRGYVVDYITFTKTIFKKYIYNYNTDVL